MELERTSWKEESGSKGERKRAGDDTPYDKLLCYAVSCGYLCWKPDEDQNVAQLVKVQFWIARAPASGVMKIKARDDVAICCPGTFPKAPLDAMKDRRRSHFASGGRISEEVGCDEVVKAKIPWQA